MQIKYLGGNYIFWHNFDKSFGLKQTSRYEKVNRSFCSTCLSTAKNMDGGGGADASCAVSLSKSNGEGDDRDLYVGA